jgi:hypothetical protein
MKSAMCWYLGAAAILLFCLGGLVVHIEDGWAVALVTSLFWLAMGCAGLIAIVRDDND